MPKMFTPKHTENKCESEDLVLGRAYSISEFRQVFCKHENKSFNPPLGHQSI